MQAAGLLFVMMIVTHGGYGKETVSHKQHVYNKVDGEKKCGNPV